MFRRSFGQRPHATNIGLPLSDGNHPARIEQVEIMARLHALVIGGQGQAFFNQLHAFGFGIFKMLEQNIGIGGLKL